MSCRTKLSANGGFFLRIDSVGNIYVTCKSFLLPNCARNFSIIAHIGEVYAVILARYLSSAY